MAATRPHLVDGTADGAGRTLDGAPAGPRFQSAKAEEAYRALQAWIEDRRVLPGQRLKEVEIAAQLGMSRTPIRQAFVQLHRDGAIAMAPNRGAVVRELTLDELDDIYGLRAVVEGFCASRAAMRMDAMAISQLAEIHEEFEERTRDPKTSAEVLIRLNGLFHQAIVVGSRSTRVAPVLETVVNVPMALKRAFWSSPRARDIASVYHREIIEAIRTADPVRAEAVMRSHIYAVKDDFIAHHRADGLRGVLTEVGS
jgi:DNA-binding GntR family transcriptional regulator